MKEVIIIILTVVCMASCVESPKKDMFVQNEQGLVYAVPIPEFSFADTVIIEKATFQKEERVASFYHVVGNYKGSLPKETKTTSVSRSYFWAVVLKE